MADGKRLLFVGAGHAHLYSLARLDRFARRGISVTVISPAAFWYSGMGPGLLSREYEPGDASVDVRAMVESRGGRFLEDRVASIHADGHYVVAAGGERVPYDALSLNVGSEVAPLPGGEGNDRVFTVKPVSRLLELRRRILRFEPGRAVRILIAGGGLAGCEAAANARALCLRHGRTASIRLVTGGTRLLPDLPEAAGERMAGWFRRNGIAVGTGNRVSGFDGDAVLFEDGLREAADFVLLATGVHPPDLLKRSDLATDGEGALLVDDHLQAVSHPGVFGAGDCIRFGPMPLARVGVYAVRQAPVLFDNLLASLLGGPMRVFRPQKRFLLILNLGDGTGLLSRGKFVASGRMAFRIKDRLDRRFMRRFRSTLHVLLFARYPAPGQAKTRLIPELGPRSAAVLHRRMTEHAAGVARAVRDSGDIGITVCCTGARVRDFRAWLGEDLQYEMQSSGDLGIRMRRAFETAFSRGGAGALAIGTDVPDLSPDILRQAVDGLREHDVVLGPAADGGYYLFGMRRCRPELFTGMEWGTGSVYRQTCDAIRSCGLTFLELPTLDDVDRPGDLARVRGDLRFAEAFGGKAAISVILPTLNEASVLGRTLDAALGAEGVEIIVADGGSQDATREIASAAGAVVLEVPGGRAAQMNAGAMAARGRILLFLHADTLLPAGYADAVRRALEAPSTVAGAFRFRTDGSGAAIRLAERVTNFRSAVFHWPYGDQGLFLEKRVFEEMGGFAWLPIMEDFELVRRLRRRGPIVTLGERVLTSARRWHRLGLLRTTFRNQCMIAGYLAGVKPARLYRYYYGGDPPG